MAEENSEFKYIVRVAQTDLDGHKQVELALSSVKGIGRRVATIVSNKAGIDRKGRIGDLSDDDLAKLQDIVENQLEDTLPAWMLNRRKDIATGEDRHVTVTDLEEIKRDDLNRLKKIRSYRGNRLERGLPVRGQRTRANNRRGLALGVSRKSVQEK